MIRLFALIREKRAQARLQQIVDDTRNSFECEQFRRRRAAALRATRRDREVTIAKTRSCGAEAEGWPNGAEGNRPTSRPLFNQEQPA